MNIKVLNHINDNRSPKASPYPPNRKQRVFSKQFLILIFELKIYKSYDLSLLNKQFEELNGFLK